MLIKLIVRVRHALMTYPQQSYDVSVHVYTYTKVPIVAKIVMPPQIHRQRVDQPRHNADDQDDDDDYENDRHRIFVLTTLILHLHSTMSTQCYYQANVQHCEDAYWQNNCQRSMQAGDVNESVVCKDPHGNVCADAQKSKQEHDSHLYLHLPISAPSGRS